MFTTLIFKEANFHIYKINEKCEVMKNDELLHEEDYIYHSTNGYDYILIEKLDGSLTMYPLDQVIYNSFYPSSIMDTHPFKCIHLDGNLRNNNLDNLESIEDIEEWRVITYPGIKENGYKVSSWGRVIRIIDNKLINTVHSKKDMHLKIKLNNNDNKPKWFAMHRIVVYEFITINMFDKKQFVNHINSIPYDNHYLNLEVISVSENNYHARILGRHNGLIRTNRIIETFCEIYVHNKGDMVRTKEQLRQLGLIKYFGTRTCSQIIRKQSYSYISDKYFKFGDYELPNKDRLTEEEIRYICELIVKHNGLVSKVLHELQSDDNNRISKSDISKIRYKYQWVEISDEYFSNNDFQNHYLKENEIVEICIGLIEHDFSIKDTASYFKAINKNRYNEYRIEKIKYKQSYKEISDRYFIIDKNGNYIPLYIKS